jgi:hypothetical protein
LKPESTAIHLKHVPLANVGTQSIRRGGNGIGSIALSGTRRGSFLDGKQASFTTQARRIEMNDKKAAAVQAKINGKDFARVYYAVHGRLPRKNAPYSKEEPHWKTDHVVECCATEECRELGIEIRVNPMNPIHETYLRAYRSAFYNWTPPE